jgi:chromosome segregation ATPase
LTIGQPMSFWKFFLCGRLDAIEKSLLDLKGTLTMNQQELAQALDDIKAQADKAKDEIVAQVASLEDAITAAGNVTPEVQTALDALKGSVQSLDDLNPDTPAP